jgi:hypothetical protein
MKNFTVIVQYEGKEESTILRHMNLAAILQVCTTLVDEQKPLSVQFLPENDNGKVQRKCHL